MELVLPHAVLTRATSGEIRWLASSPELADKLRSEIEEACLGFGARPPGMRCREALVALPSREHVLLLRVADLGADGDVPTSLGFHVLVLSVGAYAALGGDPFPIWEACPAPWHSRGDLPSLQVSVTPTARTIEQVVAAIKRDDSATLLGGAQAIVDGCRLVEVRAEPDEAWLRALWSLLPTTTRSELRGATFAFGNDLAFDAVVLPSTAGIDFGAKYLSEEQAANYPEGRYELGVQSAAEREDQLMLDQMFTRRSRREIWNMGWFVLGAVIVLAFLMQAIKWWLR